MEVDRPHRADLRVGHVQGVVEQRQATGLGEPGLVAASVLEAFTTAPGERLHPPRFQVEAADLVRPGHRDVEPGAGFDQVPGRGKAHRPGATHLRAEGRLLPGAGQRGDHSVGKIHAPDGVVLGVGDVESLSVQRQTLRLLEGGLMGRTVP